MVMNAKVVAEDMRRFTPEPVPGLHVLPFSPNLNLQWLQDRPELLTSYGVAGPYFIICNQFWMHKDHLTAFRAMAEIVRSRPGVSLICTGGTTDYRDPSYFWKLTAEADELGLGSKLRFLGHIPKRDQIELLKHALEREMNTVADLRELLDSVRRIAFELNEEILKDDDAKR